MTAMSPQKGVDSTVSVFGYLCLCLNALVFSPLFVADPWTFHALTREDSLVENLTVVWFVLAGLLLLVTALVERSFFRRCVYILGGVAMVFAAGEEISWGQRIFGFATPDFLMHLNYQKEFNVHNISYFPHSRTFDFERLYRNGTLILCMVTSAAFFCRKDRLFGIPLPSILLMLGFLMMLSFQSGAGFNEFLGFMVFKEKMLLLLFLLFTLFSGQVKLVIAAAATLALVSALYYMNYQAKLGSLREVREYLFGLGCLFYSLELALAQGRLAAISREPFSGLKLPGRRIPFWMMTCSLVIIGSIGLMFFQYFNVMTRPTVTEEEAYQSIVAGEPVVRSSFDVYLIENELIYTKEPCARADIKSIFFVHIIPADANDLPAVRKQYGFDNLDFKFDWLTGMRFGGKCLLTRPLPDYEITSIRTGQFIPEEGQIWKAEFPVGAVESGQGR